MAVAAEMEVEVIKANTLKDWLKKYSLWLLLGLVILIWALSMLIPSPSTKESTLKKAKKAISDIKDTTKKNLDEHNKKMKANKQELDAIKAIPDEKERLQKLADFANRQS